MNKDKKCWILILFKSNFKLITLLDMVFLNMMHLFQDLILMLGIIQSLMRKFTRILNNLLQRKMGESI